MRVIFSLVTTFGVNKMQAVAITGIAVSGVVLTVGILTGQPMIFGVGFGGVELFIQIFHG